MYSVVTEFWQSRLLYCGNYIIISLLLIVYGQLASYRLQMEMQITDPAGYCIKMDKHINKKTHTSFNVIFSC